MRSEVSKKNRYWLDKEKYMELYHACHQYQRWKDEYTLLDGKRGFENDGGTHERSTDSPVENVAIRRAQLAEYMKMIEDTAKETDPFLWEYIFRGVTDPTVTVTYLQEIMGMPCSHNTYYARKRRFYWLFSKKYGFH